MKLNIQMFAVTVSIDKLISSKIIKDLENELVAKKICTEDTGSQITKEGDQVTFVGLGDPTVKTYSGSITYEDLEDAGVTLLIDQQDYVAFKVKSVEEFRSKINLKGGQAERSMYKIKNKADGYVFGLHTEITTNVVARTASGSEVTSANVLSTIAEMGKLLDKKNVTSGNRWLAIDADMKEKMILAGIKFSVNEGMNGEKGGMEYAKYLGFDCYVTNNIAVSSNVHKIMAGAYNSIVFSNQILESRFIEKMEGFFGGGYSALHVYGAKVLKEKEICLLNAKFATESAI